MRTRTMLLIVAALALLALGALVGCGGTTATTVSTAGGTPTTLGIETTLRTATSPGTETTATTATGTTAGGRDRRQEPLCRQLRRRVTAPTAREARGPNLQQLGPTLTLDRIEAQITNGGGPMPAFKGTLTEEQIKTLADYVKAGVK